MSCYLTFQLGINPSRLVEVSTAAEVFVGESGFVYTSSVFCAQGPRGQSASVAYSSGFLLCVLLIK